MIKKSNVITGEDIYGTIPALAKKLKSKKIMLVYDVKAEEAALKIKEFLKGGKFEVFLLYFNERRT